MHGLLMASNMKILLLYWFSVDMEVAISSGNSYLLKLRSEISAVTIFSAFEYRGVHSPRL